MKKEKSWNDEYHVGHKHWWKRLLEKRFSCWNNWLTRHFPEWLYLYFSESKVRLERGKTKKDLIEVCEDTFGDRYNKLDKWIRYRKGTLRNRLNQEIWNRNLGGKMSINSPLSDQWTQRQMNRQKDGQTGEGMEGWGERLTYEGKDLQTNKKIDRHTDRWTKTDKWT